MVATEDVPSPLWRTLGVCMLYSTLFPLRVASRIAVLVAVVLFLVFSSSDAPPTSATGGSFDYAGTWNASLTGDITDTCALIAVQSGSSLTGAISCTVLGAAVFTGTIDQQAGAGGGAVAAFEAPCRAETCVCYLQRQDPR